jgi:threonine dehydrogenase-like Zn-dependent dehydrogenase
MRVGEWPTPRPGARDVLIAPRAAGICAGDLYLYGGKNPYAKYPLIGGHEVCGVVTEVGGEVSHVKPGDTVVIEPVVGCGACYPCRFGKHNCCVNFNLIGLHRPGGYADFVLAPEANVHLVPDGLPPVIASFAEPLGIGIHACRRAHVQAGEYVLILGAGPIGLAILEAAKARGARVVIADINEARLAFAGTLGAETLKADAKLLPTVLDRTQGEGAPVVIEATGNPQAMELTIDLVASGGRVAIVGLVKRGVNVAWPGLDFTRKEVNILGSRNSVGCFPEALELLASGKLQYPKVATQIPLWDAPGIFAKLHETPSLMHKGVLMHE